MSKNKKNNKEEKIQKKILKGNKMLNFKKNKKEEKKIKFQKKTFFEENKEIIKKMPNFKILKKCQNFIFFKKIFFSNFRKKKIK